MKIKKSTKTGNLCIFSRQDEFVDEFEELDAYNLSLKLLDSIDGLRVEIHRNVKGEVWKTYVIKSYTRWKKDRGLHFAR
jgi:hypothetical protein